LKKDAQNIKNVYGISTLIFDRQGFGYVVYIYTSFVNAHALRSFAALTDERIRLLAALADKRHSALAVDDCALKAVFAEL
jgi:hypothetical protein